MNDSTGVVVVSADAPTGPDASRDVRNYRLPVSECYELRISELETTSKVIGVMLYRNGHEHCGSYYKVHPTWQFVHQAGVNRVPLRDMRAASIVFSKILNDASPIKYGI